MRTLALSVLVIVASAIVRQYVSRRRTLSAAWLRDQARQETTQGWSGAVRWRSPAELRQIKREERERQQRLDELRSNFGRRRSA